jgi:hypothetical protein
MNAASPRRRYATTGQIVRAARNLKILSAVESGDVTEAEVGRQFHLSAARVCQVRRELLARSSSGEKT